ncbi:hypothetical protein GCM10022212_11310 [Actimicrobium antarcticum]|uniref:Uncharacterized protein n=2 Tax=Actimicrobium antarcticum TaxID=1051899 RepID=A0ABP7SW88_9BURK
MPTLQQPSLTPDQVQRIEQFLAANATPDQPAFTPEDRANLTTLLSMQDAIEAVINPSAPAPNAMLLREDMDKLIQSMQIKFADDREKQQWAAEIGALKAVYPDTAKGGLLLYNLLSRALIGLYHNAPQITSGHAGTSNGMASPGASRLGALASLLSFVPMAGNQATLAVQAGISIVDQKRMARNLLKGLEAMASVGNAGTPLEQEATMRHITHALAYRLTLHHCEKPLSGDSAVTQAVKSAIGIDNRSINNFQSYAQKITKAIMKSDETFDGANVGLAINRLLTAALTGTVTGPSQERAQKNALALGEEHQRIIDGLRAAAVPVNPVPARSTAPVTGVLPLRLQSSGWVRPTQARLPDLVSALGILEPAADEVVTPKSQRLLDKIYRSDDEEKVMDAGVMLDTRVRMKQEQQQNAQLRAVLQTLIDKPADPALGTLRQDVDRLSDQLASLQTTLTAAHGSATSAQADIRALTSQVLALSTTLASLEGGVTAMRVALDDLPTKGELAELGQSVAQLGQQEQYLTRGFRDLERTVSKLSDESDPGASSSGGQMMMMARSGRAQGQSVADQYAQLTKLQDHVSTLALAIADLQAQLGVATPKPEPDPNEATNRSQLFGNLFNKASRR